MLKKNSFIFYESFYDAISDLKDAERLQLYDAICEYGFTRNIIELNGIVKTIFTLIKPQLEANWRRFENGCKGGAPQGNSNACKNQKQPKNNQKITKKQPKNKLKQANEKEKEKEKEKEECKGKRLMSNESIDNILNFDESFRSVLIEWLDYKKSRKESYASQVGINKFYKELLKLSNNNPETAQEIIDFSIARNYAGIFEPKEKSSAKKESNSLTRLSYSDFD